MMFKTLTIILGIAMTGYSAEIPNSYTPSEKQQTFMPEVTSGTVETYAMPKDTVDTTHPVYREADRNLGRARIQPVRPVGPVIKHDAMLADQPIVSTDVNRVDEMSLLGNGYIPGAVEVAYPEIPYAPGYLYDTGYSASNNYDIYGPNSYMAEPDTSAVSLLWSQMPYGRTLVSYVGRTILWVFNSIFVLLLGSLLTVGVCSYTNLCTIAFHGVGPIHEEMRALMTPERLEKISHAADFVKTAIDKYQKIQKVTDVNNSPAMRRRRAIFNLLK